MTVLFWFDCSVWLYFVFLGCVQDGQIKRRIAPKHRVNSIVFVTVSGLQTFLSFPPLSVEGSPRARWDFACTVVFWHAQKHYVQCPQQFRSVWWFDPTRWYVLWCVHDVSDVRAHITCNRTGTIVTVVMVPVQVVFVCIYMIIYMYIKWYILENSLFLRDSGSDNDIASEPSLLPAWRFAYSVLS